MQISCGHWNQRQVVLAVETIITIREMSDGGLRMWKTSSILAGSHIRHPQFAIRHFFVISEFQVLPES
jgi:hypothetical protein